jgi:hypothetical protein
LQLMQPLLERLAALETPYWQVHRSLRHRLQDGLPSSHLIFFSRHVMHALPRTSLDVEDSSTMVDLVREAAGERDSFPFLLFFAVDMWADSGEPVTALFFRPLLAFRVFEEVDMSRCWSL